MFSQVITRTVLGAVLTATLLAPTAAADSWARAHQIGLDPAIATALYNRSAVTAASNQLDPAIKAAIVAHKAAVAARPDDRAGTRVVAGGTSIPLDPAIKAAMLAQQTANQPAPPRPDDRAGTHGPGPLSVSAPVAATSGGVEWNSLGVGAGAVLGALLLALASVTRLRHLRTRVTNA